ncbi:MAG: S8 family serine peptidase [Chromatiales bacterium]|nr:S8 family serine peptidase [Chromatiales bacterium]
MGIKSVAVATACAVLVALLNAAAIAPARAQAAEQATEQAGATTRLIIKLRPAATTAGSDQSQLQPQLQPQTQAGNRVTPQGQGQDLRDRARGLARHSGLGVRAARDLGRGMVALGLDQVVADEQLEQALAALRADPAIEFAEVDRRRFVRALPNDPLYASQWYLQGVETSATNFEAAWDTTTGSADTVIAILDTGIRFDHPDLAGRVVPGYDFVSGESSSSFVSANDGNDWDNDAADPGDWVSSAEAASGPLRGCDVGPSSWHGTRVAAMVGAATGNATGVAGGTWSSAVLPVRVLGKCGGYDSDIVAGMRWAAGLPVTGVPLNPNPARIINLSLGSVDRCASVYSNVIAELTAAGVLVIAAAGNDSGPVETPANCPGVLAVGGLRHVGTKVGYSSLGAQVGISAPAGNCPELDTTFLCGFSLITADNTGQTVPAASSYTDDANYNIGTSFSAPIVAAVAGLMHGVNSGLTSDEYIARIKAGARPFPAPDPGLPTCPSLDRTTSQCNCTTTTCGAGIADAPGAVAEALRPMARVVKPAGTGAGQNVVLDGSSSAAARNRTISSYAWTAVSGNPAFVGTTNGQTATVAVPSSGQVTVQLEVTDDLGRKDVRAVTLGAAPGGGGGGGGIHPLVLLALGLSLVRRRKNQR